MEHENTRAGARVSNSLTKPDLDGLDFDVHAAGEVEPHESVDRLVGGLVDVQKSVVGAKLEVLHRLLVDVWTTNNAELADSGWERDWAGNSCARSLRGVGDLLGRSVEDPVVISSKSNSNFHICLLFCNFRKFQARGRRAPTLRTL